MRKLALLAKAAITSGLLAYLFLDIDVKGVLAQVARSDPQLLAGGTLMLALLPVLGALRWRLILSCITAPPPFLPVARWTYISVFFSQVLPATVGGDALRMWLAHRGGCGLQSAVTSVGIDRVAMLLSLACLLTAGASRLHVIPGGERVDNLAPLLLAACVAAVVVLMLADRLPPRMLRVRAVRAIGHLGRDARHLFLKPRCALATLALCLASYAVIMASVYVFALAFGANSRPSQLLVLLPPVLAASTLPISIGGWGTREIAMVAALGTIGIGSHTAVLVSIWLGIASIIVSVPGAFLYLTHRVTLKAAARAASTPAGS